MAISAPRGRMACIEHLSSIDGAHFAGGPLLAATAAAAGEADGELLQPVTVTATGVSNMTAASAGDVSMQQIASNPLLRPALLENVPGLIVTQHSGEGKANQYFLRAFNLDHGTDIAIGVDGMPVNLPSHAHGQGYADLNFLIPDLITDLHYKKGPYFADEGDFATAAAVRFALIDTAAPTVTVGYGEDGYRRALIMGSTAVGRGSLLAAGEGYHTCPQPIAIVGRYIPNSPTSVIEAGVQVHPASGWFGAIQARHFGESPLVEDNSARSPAYTTVDIQIGYHSPRRWRAALDIFNVANVKWNDIEYYYVSRLRNEPWPAAGYVVHPGVPRTLRIRLEYSF